jgi:hypothetical protein
MPANSDPFLAWLDLKIAECKAEKEIQQRQFWQSYGLPTKKQIDFANTLLEQVNLPDNELEAFEIAIYTATDDKIGEIINVLIEMVNSQSTDPKKKFNTFYQSLPIEYKSIL